MKILIIFLTLFLWTEIPRAAVIKRDDHFMKHDINPAVNLRHQKGEKKHNAKKVAQKLGAPLSKTDFYNAKFVDISSPKYKPEEDPTLIAGLFEGDIAGIDISAVKAQGRNAIINPNLKWPNATIPYEISAEYGNITRALIARSMEEYHGRTCIRFVPKTSAHKDFLRIVPGIGCSSAVGRIGGGQHFSLGMFCLEFGIILHELMHAVGFWHEQSRADRDDYITIIWSNIIKDKWHNFFKYSWKEIQSLGAPYDIGSLMHYGEYALAINKSQPTIISKVKGKKIGKRDGFSEMDVWKINKLYKCRSKTSGNCTDLDENCPEFKEQGQCQKNPVYMSFFCMKTCRLCGPECVDQNESCPKWISHGLCYTNAEYMQVVCPKSCKVCT